MTKLGGVIGFVLGFALTLWVGDHIDFLSRQSDYLGNAVAIAVAIGGWAAGSWIVRRLTAHYARPRSLP
jgi:hypothetical protein